MYLLLGVKCLIIVKMIVLEECLIEDDLELFIKKKEYDLELEYEKKLMKWLKFNLN
jgi:hypothetical protein